MGLLGSVFFYSRGERLATVEWRGPIGSAEALSTVSLVSGKRAGGRRSVTVKQKARGQLESGNSRFGA